MKWFTSLPPSFNEISWIVDLNRLKILKSFRIKINYCNKYLMLDDLLSDILNMC